MSFDNSANTKIKRLNLALLVLLTLLSLAIAVFVPFFGIAGVIFLPVSATLLVLSGRIRDGVICAVISSVILIFLDYLLVPAAALLIIGISFIYRSSMIKEKGRLFTISCIFLAFFGVLLLYVITYSAIYGVNYINEFINYYNSYIDQVLSREFLTGYAGLFSLEQSQFEVIVEQARDILEFMLYIIPGILISLVAFISFMNHVATNAVLKRYNTGIKGLPSLRYWDTPWYLCWGMILGLVLIVIPPGSQSINKVLDIAGLNLVAVFAPLYLILGIAVIWGLMEKFKLPLLWRVVIFVMLGLFFNFALIIVVFLGLMDIWVNFR
ncbi:MAG: DUF2232 domain-containing protein, partial [Actinomycetota bacterium]|nr:DUF2232 domain-containing protein [Actinomycetota bacterium]